MKKCALQSRGRKIRRLPTIHGFPSYLQQSRSSLKSKVIVADGRWFAGFAHRRFPYDVARQGWLPDSKGKVVTLPQQA